jgi:hypothetical protein
MWKEGIYAKMDKERAFQEGVQP